MSGQSQPEKSGVTIEVQHATRISVDFNGCWGTMDGINICVDNHDDHAISPDDARRLANVLLNAAEAVEERQ